MITEVRQSIYTVGNISELGDRFYFIQAPMNIQKPYGVFTPITSVESIDSVSQFESMIIQVDLFGLNLGALEAIEKKIKDAYQDSETQFNSVSYHCDRIDRDFSRVTLTDEIFQITIQYKLEFTKL